MIYCIDLECARVKIVHLASLILLALLILGVSFTTHFNTAARRPQELIH